MNEYCSCDIGAYTSISLLLATSFFGISNQAYLIYLIPVVFSFLCGLFLLFWWRNVLTKSYIDKVKTKEKKELQKILDEKNMAIHQLKSDNDQLSKIIHKDNKLIPAMEFAVREYLITAEKETDSDVLVTRAKELLEYLDNVTKERSGILKSYEIGNKKLPLTNILSIDSLLLYMSQKAYDYQISFDISITGSVTYFIDHHICELDAKTILADLIENAIIATKKSDKKKILVNIGVRSNFYIIEVYDSGDPFTTETLLNIGYKKTTTHQKEGGSGIGLMTILEISKRYQASFIIEEFSGNDLFTKKVSIFFDNLALFQIKTMQVNEIKPLDLCAGIPSF